MFHLQELLHKYVNYVIIHLYIFMCNIFLMNSFICWASKGEKAPLYESVWLMHHIPSHTIALYEKQTKM